MKKIKEYFLIKSAKDHHDFIDLVNRSIGNSNWQPFGSPFRDQENYYQAVVKYED